MNWYAYVRNDPVNMADPTGEFGILGALIGGSVEAGLQIASSMGNGASFSEAASNLNYGSIGAQAALGAVGGLGAKLVTAGVKGTATIGKGTLTSATEKVAVGTQGAKLVSGSAAASAGMRGGDMTDQVGIKLVDAAVGVPVATAVANKDAIVDGINTGMEKAKEILTDDKK